MTRKSRIRLAEAQNWRCAFCTGVMEYAPDGPAGATTEHIRPVDWGHAEQFANKIAACGSCNSHRGNLAIWLFYRLRRHALNTGQWPPCGRPSSRIRKILKREKDSIPVRRHARKACTRALDRMWEGPPWTSPARDRPPVDSRLAPGATYRLRLKRWDPVSDSEQAGSAGEA